MNKKILSIILVFASMAVISAQDKLGLPVNYTWPLNNTNLCFAARFDLKLNVAYTRNDSSNTSVVIPLNNSTFGSYSVACSAPSNVHQLTISMFNGLTTMSFIFVNDEKNMTSLQRIYGYITVDEHQDFIKDYSPSTAGLHKFSSNASFFQTGVGNSFRCNTKTQITNFQINGTLTITSLDIENLQIQPFVDDSKQFNKYGAEVFCKADVDKNSNLIPIIVGACLAVLVVVVLVAYLIGRRRGRNGYQSV